MRGVFPGVGKLYSFPLHTKLSLQWPSLFSRHLPCYPVMEIRFTLTVIAHMGVRYWQTLAIQLPVIRHHAGFCLKGTHLTKSVKAVFQSLRLLLSSSLKCNFPWLNTFVFIWWNAQSWLGSKWEFSVKRNYTHFGTVTYPSTTNSGISSCASINSPVLNMNNISFSVNFTIIQQQTSTFCNPTQLKHRLLFCLIRYGAA